MPREIISFLVTEEDIANGVPEDGDACPAALALTRRMGFPVSVSCDHAEVWLPGSSRLPSYQLEQRLEAEIENFDDGGDFMPGLYEVWREVEE